VTIRAIRPDDKGLMIDAFDKVSAGVDLRRFLMMKKEITPQELKQATEVDFVNVVALVAFLEKDGINRSRAGGDTAGRPGKGQRWHSFVETHSRVSGSHRAYSSTWWPSARNSGITQFEAEVLLRTRRCSRCFARSGIPLTRTATRDSVHVLMELTMG